MNSKASPWRGSRVLGFTFIMVGMAWLPPDEAWASASADKAQTPGAKPVTYLRENPSPPPTEANTQGSSLRHIGGFLLLGALVASAYVLKRRAAPKALLVKSPNMKVISSLSIGIKSQLVLVSVGSENLLLAVSESGVQTLRTFSAIDSSPLADSTGSEAPEATPVLSPAREFERLLGVAERESQSVLDRAAVQPKARPADAKERHKTRPGLRVVEDDDSLPEHLSALLEETPPSSFGEPEGQAHELLRRFREFRA